MSETRERLTLEDEGLSAFWPWAYGYGRAIDFWYSFLDSCLSAGFLLLCFSAVPALVLFLLRCFSASLFFCLLLFLLLCFSCFSALCFPCFFAFPASLLFCSCASEHFYLYYSTFSVLQSCGFAAPLPAPLILYFLPVLSLFAFHFFLLSSFLFVS